MRDWANNRNEASGIKPLSGPTKPRKHLIDPDLPDIYRSKGFVDDLKTGRWMLIPGTPSDLLAKIVADVQHRLSNC
jgi:hypothetical protein